MTIQWTTLKMRTEKEAIPALKDALLLYDFKLQWIMSTKFI